jgi:DNA-binding NtrC family response regulator
MMLDAKVQILIVDDEPSIRMSLSQIFTGSGHSVRSAVDGFSALREIRQGIPDILLSDLNMPGMSGFELLSVVRRRFPAIQVIAMSGTFAGNGIPPGVAADFFYEKGSGLGLLLEIVETLTRSRQRSRARPDSMAPIWIPKNGHDPSGEAYVMITCPECLRTFPQVLDESICLVQETGCAHCSSSIQYAIVQPALSQAFQWKSMASTVLDLDLCEQE